jgi:membrane protease YdiL (CAAX protease family)
MERAQKAPRLASKLLMLAAVAMVLGSNYWPESVAVQKGMNALGHPPYAGFRGAFLPHLLLYTTVMAAVSALLWWIFVRARLLPPPSFGNVVQSLRLGIAGGIAGILLTLAVVWLSLPAGTIHYISPVPWKIAGNIFSNFYEEFVFRGFVLTAVEPVAGFWTAAVLSSAIWGLLHSQYPLTLKVLIAVIGVGLCWLRRLVGSLWAPYVAHEVLDLIGDSLIG